MGLLVPVAVPEFRSRKAGVRSYYGQGKQNNRLQRLPVAHVMRISGWWKARSLRYEVFKRSNPN